MTKSDLFYIVARVLGILVAAVLMFAQWYTGVDGFDVLAGITLGAVGLRRPGDVSTLGKAKS